MLLITVLVFALSVVITETSPTLYEYYTGDGITTGLSVDQPYFTLNNKNITIHSGTMHYFRIPRIHWEDRLKKLRAAGLNTVETYIPWNLHEPEKGVFDFGSGGTDWQAFLDLEGYLEMAKAQDLFVIVRPGPFICAEWEWGGFPSWLLREEGIEVRTSDAKFMQNVKRYFDVLLPKLAELQFTKGGPIIAIQVENEYGSSPVIDLNYVQQLYDMMKDHGIVELLVSSDNAWIGTKGTLPGVLFQTVNFGSDPKSSFDTLKEMQPNQPLMAMEYWPGWFDHWSEPHHTVSSTTFQDIYEDILTYPASVNMYMFHGGTNFGFLNGASIDNGSGDNSGFNPVTTSYDYDAPLAENGDYTDKYYIVKDLLQKYNTIDINTPDMPELVERKAYPTVKIDGQLNFNEMIQRAPGIILSEQAVSMEHLPINQDSGQSFGYIVYHKDHLSIKADSVLTITGHIRDTVMVLVNGVLVSKPLSSSADFDGFGYWRLANSSITLTSTDLEDATLDLVVENWGRVNYGNLYHQYKGLIEYNTVYLNGEELSVWIIYPFQFKKEWNTNLFGWNTVENDTLMTGPGLYKGTLTVEYDYVNEPRDTYLNMEGWTKGVVIVNGFVVGRYAFLGPQQTLYLPFLQLGDNEIIIFEQFKPGSEINFSQNPIFYTP